MELKTTETDICAKLQEAVDTFNKGIAHIRLGPVRNVFSIRYHATTGFKYMDVALGIDSAEAQVAAARFSEAFVSWGSESGCVANFAFDSNDKLEVVDILRPLYVKSFDSVAEDYKRFFSKEAQDIKVASYESPLPPPCRL